MIKINQKQNCSGCHACVSVCPKHCISMVEDNEGFLYPQVDEPNCISCGMCEKVCPIIHQEEVSNEPKAYACYNKDEPVRMESSSGGLFTLIAEQVINNGGVVFGASFDKEFNVAHRYVETKEELGELRGSKYVQSKIGDTYKKSKEFLKQGRQVLFTGTPCQIGGLKSYLEQDYNKLFCIDIICHGVPSPKVWKKYVSYRENRAGAPARRIAFRRKDGGWKRFSVSFLFNNDTEYVQTVDKDLYMQAFLKNACLRPSCYACNFKTLHRESDITLADFWGIQNVFSEMDDDKGASLVFVNSTSGESMFAQIKDKISYKEVDINQAVAYNSSAIKSVEYNPKREKFFNKVDQLPFDELVNKYCSDAVLVRIKRRVKSVVCIVLKKMGLFSISSKVL